MLLSEMGEEEAEHVVQEAVVQEGSRLCVLTGVHA